MKNDSQFDLLDFAGKQLTRYEIRLILDFMKEHDIDSISLHGHSVTKILVEQILKGFK